MLKFSPRVDFIFMKLFANKNSKNILIDFINSTVFEEDSISDLELKSEYTSTGFQPEANYILETVATGNNGKTYNIAIQVLGQDMCDRSALFHWSRMYSNGYNASEKIDNLNKTICINILNFNYLDEKKHHNIFRTKNIETNRELGNHLEIHFIELEKFNDRVSTMLDRWVNFFIKADKIAKDLPEDMKMDPSISEAFDILGQLKLTKAEKDAYDPKIKSVINEEKIIKIAEERGLHEGEKKKAIEIARNLLDLLDIRTIAEKTGLSVEDIIKLKKNQL